MGAGRRGRRLRLMIGPKQKATTVCYGVRRKTVHPPLQAGVALTKTIVSKFMRRSRKCWSAHEKKTFGHLVVLLFWAHRAFYACANHCSRHCSRCDESLRCIQLMVDESTRNRLRLWLKSERALGLNLVGPGDFRIEAPTRQASKSPLPTEAPANATATAIATDLVRGNRLFYRSDSFD